jgi:hypothetical protein
MTLLEERAMVQGKGELLFHQRLKRPHESRQIIIIELFASGEIHVHFIDGCLLNNGGIIAEERIETLGDLSVLAVASTDSDQSGTEDRALVPWA